MRFNINLASNPYEVAQSYRRQMTLIIAALGLIAVLLVGYIFYQRQRSRGINHQLAQIEGEIQGLDHEESQARAILNKPANRVIADQSDFLNQMFARKALSWTRIFTEMEKIVPPGLHVVSMKPEYTKSNDLMLHVIVATDSRERAVELVRKMEKSSHLRQAQIVAETVTTNQSNQAAGGGNIQFDIAAIYVPGTLEGDEAAQGKASGAATARKIGVPITATPSPAQPGPQFGSAATSGESPMQSTARNRSARPGQPREQH